VDGEAFDQLPRPWQLTAPVGWVLGPPLGDRPCVGRADQAQLLGGELVRDFYRNHTHLLIDAVNTAREEHRATLAAAHAELKTVRAQLAHKEATIDDYFTDYETNKIDKALLERRIAKLSDELTQLRRRRDQLQLRIDDAPEQITPQQVATLGEDVHNIINYGTDTERKHLCELLIEELKINPATATATPIFRVNLTAPRAIKNTESPSTSSLTKGKAQLTGCSRA
jgi:site-specific DNA recombinase